MKGRILDSQATLYAEPDTASSVIATLIKGQEIEITGVAPNGARGWTTAGLPNGQQGYLLAATRIYGFRPTQLVKDTDVYAEASVTSPVRVRYAKGATLLIIGITENEGRKWLRVRDGDSEEGYILGENIAVGRARISPAAVAAQRAKQNMIVGGAFCLGGIAVTIGTYAAASGGGTYVVAWGAIVFGGWRFLRGLAGLGDA